MAKKSSILFGILIGICIIVFAASRWFYEPEQVISPLDDLPSYCVLDVNTIREVTECEEFPDFEATQLWYYKSDHSHSVPYIECHFKKKMNEEEFDKFCQVEKSICWGSDKDATLLFSRGWSQKEYMEIPKGMEENLFVSIDKLSRSGFTLSYKKNAGWEKIDNDYINKLTGYEFPPYTVISFENDGDTIRAILLFSNYLEKTIADVLANDLDEIKIDTLFDNKEVFFDMLTNERHAILGITHR